MNLPTVKDYCMLEKIGTGSYATVYKAIKKVRANFSNFFHAFEKMQVRFECLVPSSIDRLFVAQKRHNAYSTRSHVLHAMLSFSRIFFPPYNLSEGKYTRYRRKLDSVCIASRAVSDSLFLEP